MVAATTGSAGSGGNVDVTAGHHRRTPRGPPTRLTRSKGFIHVASGATLTIQPGTKIVGDFNTLGSSLFILRGAKIQAVGTAANPIVFTSSRAAGSASAGRLGRLDPRRERERSTAVAP